MIKANPCHCITIVRLHNRVSLDASNILAAITISVFLPHPPNPKILVYTNGLTCQLWSEWAHPSMMKANACLYMTITRLQDRVLPNASNILAAIAIYILLPSPPKSKILAYPSQISRQLWSEWAHPSIHYKGKCMSLHNRCEAVEQSFAKCIKYSKNYYHFHASTPTPQILT